MESNIISFEELLSRIQDEDAKKAFLRRLFAEIFLQAETRENCDDGSEEAKASTEVIEDQEKLQSRPGFEQLLLKSGSFYKDKINMSA